LARIISKALIAQPLFSAKPFSLFHADPHAGNLLATPAGRLGILDWSLVGHLSRESRVQLMRLSLAAVTRDTARMQDAIRNLALPKRYASGPVQEIIHISLTRLHIAPGTEWLTTLLDNLVTRAGIRFEPNLLLFRKTLLTLEGVLADLLGSRDAMRSVLDKTVFSLFLNQWLAEWPEYLSTPMYAPGSATHVSRLDLLRTFVSLPFAITSWWTEFNLRFLEQFLNSGFYKTVNPVF
jgi:ubiquinone biosynthesis protein